MCLPLLQPWQEVLAFSNQAISVVEEHEVWRDDISKLIIPPSCCCLITNPISESDVFGRRINTTTLTRSFSIPRNLSTSSNVQNRCMHLRASCEVRYIFSYLYIKVIVELSPPPLHNNVHLTSFAFHHHQYYICLPCSYFAFGVPGYMIPPEKTASILNYLLHRSMFLTGGMEGFRHTIFNMSICIRLVKFVKRLEMKAYITKPEKQYVP